MHWNIKDAPFGVMWTSGNIYRKFGEGKKALEIKISFKLWYLIINKKQWKSIQLNHKNKYMVIFVYKTCAVL